MNELRKAIATQVAPVVTEPVQKAGAELYEVENEGALATLGNVAKCLTRKRRACHAA